MPLGASAKPREAPARRWKAVTLLASAGWDTLMPACGRTGALGGISYGVPQSAGEPHATQPVSTKALGEGHTRMTTRIGAPQTGQRAVSGGGGVCWIGWSSLGWACTIRRRMVAIETAQLVWSKPQWRTF